MPNYAGLVPSPTATRALDALAPIRAYHASPHDFNKFDTRFRGRGEGAEAVASGLYFAQEPKVVDHYYDMFEDTPGVSVADSERAAFLAERLRIANERRRGIHSYHDRLAETDGVVDDVWGGMGPDPDSPKFQRSLGLLDANSRRAQEASEEIRGLARRGNRKRYEVEIGYPEQALLDWDAPLGGQSEAVRDLLDGVGHRIDEFATSDSGRLVRTKGGWLLQNPGSEFRLTEQEARRLIGQVGSGGEAYSAMAASLGGKAAASKSLFEAGVPGVRYLDGDSRAVGGGTRNYVMFPGTEDQIRILRKYSMLPIAGAGAAASQDE